MTSGLIQTRISCSNAAYEERALWRWTDWLNSTWNLTLDELPPVSTLNSLQVKSGGHAHVHGRTVCRISDLIFLNGMATASPISGRKRFEAAISKARETMQQFETRGSSKVRLRPMFRFLPHRVSWADVPSNVTLRRPGSVFLAPSLPSANVGHAGQVLFWHAASAACAASTQACTDEPLILTDRRADASHGWFGAVASALGRPIITQQHWATDSCKYLVTDALVAPLNIGHPDNLPEEWISNSAAAEGLRRRLIMRHAAAVERLACASTLCVTIMNRASPRTLLDQEKLITAMQEALAPRHPGASILLESFDERPFEEQLAVMNRTAILVAPHGAGMVNVAFMPRCAAVIEAYPCGLPIPFYGTLAWNTGHVYLPVHPRACMSQAGGAWTWPRALECVNSYTCRTRARKTPVRLGVDEAVRLVNTAFRLRKACLTRAESTSR
jgi:hypothetical protein